MPCEKPLLSIIVPVYKVENYLQKCIDSILAQTFTDFELIPCGGRFAGQLPCAV